MQLENSHGNMAGRSLVNVIQESLDKAIVDFNEASGTEALRLQGYVAGIAKALGILRGTSVKSEIDQARQRIGERSKSNVEIISEVGTK